MICLVSKFERLRIFHLIANFNMYFMQIELNEINYAKIKMLMSKAFFSLIIFFSISLLCNTHFRQELKSVCVSLAFFSRSLNFYV
jgi:hypothetical protein